MSKHLTLGADVNLFILALIFRLAKTVGGKANSISDVKTLLKLQFLSPVFSFFLHEMRDKWISRNHEKDSRNTTM